MLLLSENRFTKQILLQVPIQRTKWKIMQTQYVSRTWHSTRLVESRSKSRKSVASLTLSQIKLGQEDAEGLKSFETLESTGKAGGLTIKKFTVNAGKEQLILEFNVGASKKKEPEADSKVGSATKAKGTTANTTTANTKKSAKAGFAYDSIPQV